MALNPVRLRLLEAFDRLGTIRAVGRELDLSPSTVSQQLSVLEAETGAALLERRGRTLTLTPTGGYLGLPASGLATADMRVVDIYRRQDDKLAENWVFIDILHFLNMQGLDVLERQRSLNRSGTAR